MPPMMLCFGLFAVYIFFACVPVLGHTPKYRRTGPRHARPLTLHPTLHPSINTRDHVHLQASDGLQLHYHDPHAAFEHIRSFATVYISGFHYPSVALEHSVHVESTFCDASAETITVTFSNHDAWAYAVANWRQHPIFYLVAFADTCGAGRESGERSVHLVTRIVPSEPNLEIACEMEETSLEDAIHPAREVSIDVDTFDVHRRYPGPNPPSAPYIQTSSAATRANYTHLPINEAIVNPESSGSSSAGDMYYLRDQGIKPDPVNYNYASDQQLYDFRVAQRLDEPVDLPCLDFDDVDDAGREELFPQAAPSSDPDLTVGSLQGRAIGDCGKNWLPFLIIRDCILLPILKFTLPSELYDLMNGLLSLDVTRIYKIFENVIEAAKAILSEKGYTPGGEVTFDTNVSHPMDNTDEFGYAYKVFEASKEKGDASVTFGLYCVECRIYGYIKHQSRFKFSFLEGFTVAEVDVTSGRIDFSAGIGIIITATYEVEASKTILTIPLSPLAIPGLIVIGPFVSVDVGVDLTLTVTGKILARSNIGWTQMTAKIDMLDGSRSFIGDWNKTKPVPLVSVELSGSAELAPYIATGLKFGIDILNGKLKLDAGLQVKTSIVVTVSGAVNSAAPADCNGLTVTLGAKFDAAVVVEGGTYSETFFPQEFAVEAYSTCIGIANAVKVKELAPAISLPLLPVVYDDQLYVTISVDNPKGNLHVMWFPPGDDKLKGIFVLPPLAGNDTDDSIIMNRVFISSKNPNHTDCNATTGTADNRVFYIHDVLMLRFGASPLYIAPKDQVPRHFGTVMALRSEGSQKGGEAFSGGVVTNSLDVDKRLKRYYWPVVCTYDNQRLMPRLFLTSEPVKFPATILDKQNDRKANTWQLSGNKNKFTKCEIAKLRIG
ncbi:hypothetical protein MVEN_00497200 [Mycena venus]|uniref:Uncharacterized protein n=1 Tax=Mycena venus TaxID=2733690 RepID=A0A8H6YXP0_9AGAR|nr:hypothetical protein MVEN_00497200 [Mycena venus]